MSAHNEYLPDSASDKEESILELQLRVMRQVMTDILADGSRVLFIFLLQSSWLRKFGGIAPGVIKISVSQLSRHLRRTPRSIIRWKQELIGRGYIWITEKALPNARPIHVYHISALTPPQPEGHQTSFDDGAWGPENPAYGHKVNGKFAPQTPPYGHKVNGETPQNDNSQKTLSPLPDDLKSTAHELKVHSQLSSSITGSGLKGQRAEDLKSTPSCPQVSLAVDKKGNGQMTKTGILKETPDKRNQENSGGSAGTPQKKLLKGNNGLPPVPEFEPIPDGTFPSRLEKMLSECDAAEAAIHGDERFKENKFMQGQNCNWLECAIAELEASKKPEDKKKVGEYQAKIARLKSDPANYVKDLSDFGREHLGAWRARRRWIKVALSGKKVVTTV